VFVKVAVVVLSLGAFAAGLLSLRQSRLQVASEVTQSQLRIEQADRRLWQLRAAIAARVTPQAVEDLAKEAGPMRPLALPPLPIPDEKSETDARVADSATQELAPPASRAKSQKTADRRSRNGADR
jgi:hypothetical protein